MASGAGTLLSDLDSASPAGGGADGDLVQRILADVNGPSSAPPPPLPNHLPAHANPGYNSGMNVMSPNQGAAGQMMMDSRIPTSHMIGGEHPTAGDFARAMAGLPSMTGSLMGAAPQPPAPLPTYEPPRKNFYARVIEESKVPFVVMFLFFIFSLPPVRILFAHYLPQLVKPTGEFQLLGLAVVSLLVGFTFWVLQRVIVPLLSY